MCKHHHLLFHNNGWEIERNAVGEYWLIPPKSHDPEQNPILLQPKGNNMRDLRTAARQDALDALDAPEPQDAPDALGALDEVTRVFA